mgnify:CR=1 FL=1
MAGNPPKRKVSRSNTRSRRAQWKAEAPTLVKTVESGEEPTGPAAEAIRRQVESLLAIDMEDPELHEAMDVVADLWKSKGMGNTAENRRNLRSDLERQAVERCEDFVRQMAPMRDMLRQAEANADLLDKQAQASVEDLEKTDAETRRVVAAHEQLLATRDQLQREHDLATGDAFAVQADVSDPRQIVHNDSETKKHGGDRGEHRPL